ncbi:PREDICTED: GDSL esterase/lipase At5g03610-like [Populus euphratica]|uniref:GDSL esterase/lipase At5g03610-like n=1 Tax=Populus euphratica TaxID=75702 RepID=A0AAJ6Y6X2_POPEU|nr:PREDICTED: GDSL esterase/lipase At5g03610-like [Populus euphratica]
MDKQQKLLFHIFVCFSFLLLLSENTRVYGSSHHHHHHHHRHRPLFNFRPSKLFVFGDSYADTGNNRNSLANSWKVPYGITFPGKPAGRFSDGRVLTDFIAKSLGIKSPIPYRWRNVGIEHWKNGMNFAYGGTGVFPTLAPDPNMTTQIDFFQDIIHKKIYSRSDLCSSMALVSVAGNDYSTYATTNGSPQGWQPFIIKVVNQLVMNMKRIHGMGVNKVVVTALQPLGCLPRSTFTSSFQQCNGTENDLVGFHNLLLQQAVTKLNNETKDSTFAILDLYKAFMDAFKSQGKNPGSSKFGNPLKPCCTGISTDYGCGSVDANGAKKYVVCDDPESTFFWDTVHPTQEGWRAVYSALLQEQ